MLKKKSSLLNLGHKRDIAMSMGQIVPIACFDVVPGDIVRHKIHALIRTQPLLAPVMHTVDIDVHAYFSPDRLVWEDSEDFHSGGDDGMAAPEWPHFAIPGGGYAVGSLADYIGGIPIGDGAGLLHSALPFRHYANIWNHWYRDSQLQSELTIDQTSGLDTTTSMALQAPCWKRDYFTKCRPNPQLGDEVVIPLTGDAPVVTTGAQVKMLPAGSTERNINFTAGGISYTGAATGTVAASFGTVTGLEADLSAVTGIPVRELREANASQRFLENNNIFGGRYMEQLMARWGVRPQDQRLQWPEFLGRGEAKIQFSEVLATAETGASVDVGDMKGHGISMIASDRYRYRVKEHGWIMVFLILRPKTQYQQGLHRSHTRQTKYDYLLPEFQHIGDQAVLNQEIYAAAAAPSDVFGYTPVYEEYRTIPSSNHGAFRTTLNYWNMTRIFASEPALNSTFVAANPTTRIFPDTSGSQLYVSVNNSVTARRQLTKSPVYKLM